MLGLSCLCIAVAGELWEFLVNLEGAVRIGKVDAKLAEMVMNRFMLKEGQEVRGHLDKMMFPVDSLYVGQLWFGESANFEECFLFYSAPNGWVEWWDDPVGGFWFFCILVLVVSVRVGLSHGT